MRLRAALPDLLHWLRPFVVLSSIAPLLRPVVLTPCRSVVAAGASEASGSGHPLHRRVSRLYGHADRDAVLHTQGSLDRVAVASHAEIVAPTPPQRGIESFEPSRVAVAPPYPCTPTCRGVGRVRLTPCRSAAARRAVRLHRLVRQ
jgi:hypothetical protein